jgi:formylglycine-generating enzyme
VKWHRVVSVMAALVLAVTASAARAEISIEFVTVGNPGNAGELSGEGAGGYGPDAIVGSVDDVYRIAKYEVTAGQYTAFLNAVAKTDTYELYNTDMWSYSDVGCKIQRSGSSGSYTYSVTADRANRPVNYVSWGDAARFMNWLHNDQPIGAQGPGTTETGAYTLNGATSDEALMAITRSADAKYWIPTENEWYKAAYYDPNKSGGPDYWDYPTGSDNEPSNQLTSPDPGNNANFSVYGGSPEYTIGSPYWMTEVGAFTNSDSPYGTFDQGGNVFEWNETAVTDSSRVLRGGSWVSESDFLLASYRIDYVYPTLENYNIGFRVATVPEPGSLTLMLCGALVGLFFWRRRK